MVRDGELSTVWAVVDAVGADDRTVALTAALGGVLILPWETAEGAGGAPGAGDAASGAGALSGAGAPSGARAQPASDAPNGDGGPADGLPPPRALAAAIRRLPPDATAVAWLAGARPTPDRLAAMVAALADHGAVVAAVAHSDAVKRVQGGRIVAGVDRDGLCRPVPPLLVRADVARGALLDELDRGSDVADALAAAGCRVAVDTGAGSGP